MWSGRVLPGCGATILSLDKDLRISSTASDELARCIRFLKSMAIGVMVLDTSCLYFTV